MRTFWHKICQTIFGKEIVDRQSFSDRRKCDNFLFFLLAAMVGVSSWFVWPVMTTFFYVLLMVAIIWFTFE